MIYRSLNACSACVADHPGTGEEEADCAMVAEEGGPCEEMLLEKRWGFLYFEDHLKDEKALN